MVKGTRKMMLDFMKAIKQNPQRYYYLQSHLKRIIDEGIDVSTQGYSGNTLLHIAVNLGNKKLLTMFIKANVMLDLANDNGETPLHRAVGKGNTDLIRILIKSGCDINSSRELEQTPLHVAVINGRLDIVKLLVDNGADIMLADENNNLPIDYAIDESDVKIIKYFTTKQTIDEKRLERINSILQSEVRK